MAEAAVGIELLAPVGDREALRAAVQNGADAVYLGGKMFSARQYANNFDLQELEEVVKYAHLYGVRVYAAVNTLVDNAEFPELLEYLYGLYNINVDAVIVQDLGVAEAVRRLLPDLEMHASTQLTIHNAAGARYLKQHGFSRVVLAREVSLANIELIGRSADLPLEAFVHGALCVSYSGQCLMSSMIGGRSGNRGRCAQPCRLPYTLLDKDGGEITAGYLLSPKDLNMLDHLAGLEKAGVRALKVEGRMKRPEYVATVIRIYRRALDAHYKADENMQKELRQIFNRDFTTGYYLEKQGSQLMGYKRPNNRGLMVGRIIAYDNKKREVTIKAEEQLSVGDGYEIWVTRGGRIAGEIKALKSGGRAVESVFGGEAVFTIGEGTPQLGDRVFKTMDIGLIDAARSSYALKAKGREIALRMTLRAREGEPVRLTAEDTAGNHAEASGSYLVEKAQKHALTREGALRQLERLGNTAFTLHSFDFDCGEGLMVPVSELNNLRREVVEKLENQRRRALARPELPQQIYRSQAAVWLGAQEAAEKATKTAEIKDSIKTRLSVSVGDMESLEAALAAGADILYFGGDRLRRKKGIGPEMFSEVVGKCRAAGAEAVLLLPRIYHEEKAAETEDYCLAGKKAQVDGFLAGNPGLLQLAQELGLAGITADYTLNVFNDYAIRALAASGVERITLSPELRLEQIRNLHRPEQVRFEGLVHGSLPLMLTEHCAIGNILGKGHEKSGCPLPCRQKGYGLKDRMNMVFPLECDENCRMWVYNPKTLSLIDRIPEIIEGGLGILRIEARKEEPYWVKKVTEIYRGEIDRYERQRNAGPYDGKRKGFKQDDSQMSADKLEILQSLAPQGYTAGHYFRGVL